MICPNCKREMYLEARKGGYVWICDDCMIMMRAVSPAETALLKIKAIVEKEPCSVIGAYNLRAGVKEVLAEAGI